MQPTAVSCRIEIKIMENHCLVLTEHTKKIEQNFWFTTTVFKVTFSLCSSHASCYPNTSFATKYFRVLPLDFKHTQTEMRKAQNCTQGWASQCAGRQSQAWNGLYPSESQAGTWWEDWGDSLPRAPTPMSSAVYNSTAREQPGDVCMWDMRNLRPELESPRIQKQIGGTEVLNEITLIWTTKSLLSAFTGLVAVAG